MKLNKIRIRMYRQGLGDCFLLTLSYGANKKYHILIDCGVILGTANPEKKMGEVAQNIKDETNGKIDLVVITHEHWDHLSGFKQAQKIFDEINFDEVWMAWTEDPKNDLANKLRKTREERKMGLATALDRLKLELISNQFLSPKQFNARKAYLGAVEEITSFNGGLGANGSSSTSEALDYVKKKAKGNLSYCKPGKDPLQLKDIEGIRLFVLGPPEDEKLLKKDLANKEVYHEFFKSDFGNSFMSALNFNGDQNSIDKYRPFESSGIEIEKVKQNNSLSESYYNAENEWRQINNDWMDFSGQLALALDSDTNNTSLVLAIELTESGKFLLFPGDAQVGNWLSWHNYKWTVKNNKGENEEIDIKKIFERTTFYKVGHHGSHNATLSTNGLELMTNNELTVMIPVNKEMAKKKKWNMPFPPLLDKLLGRTSGKILMADEDLANSKKPTEISSQEWEKFKQSVNQDSGKLFFDYEINC
ncbi:MBL fold metallo-hydrolase [Solitalea lacus]|uniref:MBL fold metallo-hydrolase n=1 Tax=Solitalea lacus TaxID=2911172 RepID=UPI001EDBFE78|nr:MBL fold metallo-hydrolase [Solitalea lacus]UKJ06192.1 MBL fold metallo-hydrolase [Solitalea lacus]